MVDVLVELLLGELHHTVPQTAVGPRIVIVQRYEYLCIHPIILPVLEYLF
jgi:hypothetical protein